MASAHYVVLVVEDEPLLRMHAAFLLEEAGYTVVEACDADVAIELLLTRTDIRLVFTDIDMPGSMDGLRLAAAIRSRWPPIEIIVTSGKLSPSATDMPPRGLFLAKPYRSEALVNAAKSLLH